MLDVKQMMKNCALCPRNCGANRTEGAGGFCAASDKAEIYAAHLHFGEEPPISGSNGSGTIFFNHCNMRCVYCQNYRFSQLAGGKEFEADELKDLMLSLQGQGAHNINLVSPTHYACQVANAVLLARKNGLEIPVVYNTGGYEKTETLKFLEGLIDIYLLDMRYGDDAIAVRYSSSPDYVRINRAAAKEMHRQAGDLKLSNSGTAEKGLIIRHLLLPNGLSGTESVFDFISNEIGKGTYISFMSQYYPTYKAGDYKEISRRINRDEYDRALAAFYKCGLKNGWVQEYMGACGDSDFSGSNIEPDVFS